MAATSSSEPSSSSKTPAIATGVAVPIAVLALAGIVLFWYRSRRKKKQSNGQATEMNIRDYGKSKPEHQNLHQLDPCAGAGYGPSELAAQEESRLVSELPTESPVEHRSD
ncbi:MAG: hypothetical protein MMC23_008482 [Stictis urceolatum]|nr:hypothetical protein [Stictis urceolata]